MTARTRWGAMSAASLLAYGLLARRHVLAPGHREAQTFWWLNGRHLPWLRVPQQLGTPWVLPATAAVALATGRRRLTVAAGLALPVEKALEVCTKKLSRRPRPAQVWSCVETRDDAPTDGPSYPSGHAAIATAATVLAAGHAPAPVTSMLAIAALANGLARVQQGAHHPIDAVGGVLLGVAVGTGIKTAIGRDGEAT